MPGRRETISHILKVAISLCLVCALIVSAAAVLLRPQQNRNREREARKNILIAAGLFDPERHADKDVDRLFESVEEKVVDLADTDWYAEPPADYSQKQAVQNPEWNDPVPPDADVAEIKRREKWGYVYLIRDAGGRLDQVVLPIRGYGLWSTLWGFISIDLNSLAAGPEQATVRGLTYYQHAETPGLGGEVDNPVWKSRWKGKQVFDEDWNVLLETAKQITDPDHQVDALSGATITTNGVNNMMQYWLGEEGFGPYLQKLHDQLNQ